MQTRQYWLRSARLGFDHWRQGDIALANEVWGNPAVTKYIARGGLLTKQQISERLQLEVQNGVASGLQYWPIFSLADDRFVGCCGLRPVLAEARAAELGAHLLPDFWHQGYAAEASRTVIAYAFDHLRLEQLQAGHHPDNHASRQALLRLGFAHVGEEFYPPTGLMHPAYRLLRASYRD